MKLSARTILCGVAIVGTLAVTRAIHEPSGANAAGRAHYPLITRIATKDLTISVSSGPAGPLYTVTNRSGNELAIDLSLDDLRAQQPQLYEMIAPAIADSHQPTGWAGVELD